MAPIAKISSDDSAFADLLILLMTLTFLCVLTKSEYMPYRLVSIKKGASNDSDYRCKWTIR